MPGSNAAHDRQVPAPRAGAARRPAVAAAARSRWRGQAGWEREDAPPRLSLPAPEKARPRYVDAWRIFLIRGKYSGIADLNRFAPMSVLKVGYPMSAWTG